MPVLPSFVVTRANTYSTSVEDASTKKRDSISCPEATESPPSKRRVKHDGTPNPSSSHIVQRKFALDNVPEHELPSVPKVFQDVLRSPVPWCYVNEAEDATAPNYTMGMVRHWLTATNALAVHRTIQQVEDIIASNQVPIEQIEVELHAPLFSLASQSSSTIPCLRPTAQNIKKMPNLKKNHVPLGMCTPVILQCLCNGVRIEPWSFAFKSLPDVHYDRSFSRGGSTIRWRETVHCSALREILDEDNVNMFIVRRNGRGVDEIPADLTQVCWKPLLDGYTEATLVAKDLYGLRVRPVVSMSCHQKSKRRHPMQMGPSQSVRIQVAVEQPMPFPISDAPECVTLSLDWTATSPPHRPVLLVFRFNVHVEHGSDAMHAFDAVGVYPSILGMMQPKQPAWDTVVAFQEWMLSLHPGVDGVRALGNPCWRMEVECLPSHLSAQLVHYAALLFCTLCEIAVFCNEVDKATRNALDTHVFKHLLTKTAFTHADAVRAQAIMAMRHWSGFLAECPDQLHKGCCAHHPAALIHTAPQFRPQDVSLATRHLLDRHHVTCKCDGLESIVTFGQKGGALLMTSASLTLHGSLPCLAGTILLGEVFWQTDGLLLVVHHAVRLDAKKEHIGWRELAQWLTRNPLTLTAHATKYSNCTQLPGLFPTTPPANIAHRLIQGLLSARGVKVHVLAKRFFHHWQPGYAVADAIRYARALRAGFNIHSDGLIFVPDGYSFWHTNHDSVLKWKFAHSVDVLLSPALTDSGVPAENVGELLLRQRDHRTNAVELVSQQALSINGVIYRIPTFVDIQTLGLDLTRPLTCELALDVEEVEGSKDMKQAHFRFIRSRGTDKKPNFVRGLVDMLEQMALRENTDTPLYSLLLCNQDNTGSHALHCRRVFTRACRALQFELCTVQACKRVLELGGAEGGSIDTWLGLNARHVHAVDVDKQALVVYAGRILQRHVHPRRAPAVERTRNASLEYASVVGIDTDTVNNQSFTLFKKHKFTLSACSALNWDPLDHEAHDLVSCFFALHQIVRTRDDLMRLVKMVHTALRDGGMFVATLHDHGVLHSGKYAEGLLTVQQEEVVRTGDDWTTTIMRFEGTTTATDIVERAVPVAEITAALSPLFRVSVHRMVETPTRSTNDLSVVLHSVVGIQAFKV